MGSRGPSRGQATLRDGLSREKVREIQRKYGSRVEVVWLHDDDWFTLASLDPDVTLEDIMSEFGLTPLDDYRVRASAAIDKARAAAATKAKPAN